MPKDTTMTREDRSIDPDDDRTRLLTELGTRIEDPRVLAAVAGVDRRLFVSDELQGRAYEDAALPIGEDQTISQPRLVADMCALLRLRGDERVLDVGTGSGYHAALLAHLCAHVVSVERHASLSAQAARNLEAAGVANVTLLIGDGRSGCPAHAPFEAINVAAAERVQVPAALTDQLAEGGRLVIPVGEDSQRLWLIARRDGQLLLHDAGGVRFVPLVPG